MEIRSVLDGRSLAGRDEMPGDPEVCVAVLDGPVDLSHPCFEGADLTRVDTLVRDPAGPGPMSLHGTHVASLIFGRPGSPVTGVAPGCRGLILPVFHDAEQGRVPQLDLARAIEQAVSEGAHIINISGGERTSDGQPDAMLERALRLCGDSGVLVVAAVGNDGCDCLQVPAAVPSVLAVGAMGTAGEPLEINNWGGAYRANGVLAPGQDILGAAPGGGVRALTGSSFATPAVASVAALLVAAQLRAGRSPDPKAAGAAILETAHAPDCFPGDAPQCRRYLVGGMDADRAYDLITRRGESVMETSRLNANADAAGEGVEAAMSMSPADPAPGQVAETEPLLEGAGREAHAEDGVRPSCSCGCGGTGSCPDAQRPQTGVSASADPIHPDTITAGEVTGAAPNLPPPGPARVDGIQERGIRPSCGCEGRSSGQQPLVYAIGTIGCDFQTEARRDSFRQDMPFVDAGTTPEGVPIEVQGDPYNPHQLRDYLTRNPWASDKLTWTLMVDSSPIYALEAEPSVGMDHGEPFDEDRVRAAAGQVGGDLADVLVELAQPPVSTVHRTFRDALVGQTLKADEANYVSRVSVPGVLTGRTTRLFSGQVVPVVEVKSRGIYTWNETALVAAVVGRVMDENQDPSAGLSEQRLRKTVRAFLDKLYYQFRNLGQSDADRALNFAGTNAFLFGNTFSDGLLAAKYVPGEEDRFYTLDTISVTKSAYCREQSVCYEVVTNFFDPENDRRARLSFLQTIDVSIEVPVSVAPVHQFLGGM